MTTHFSTPSPACMGRIGFDYYTAYTPGNFYFAGLRYGMSTFEDEGEFLLDSEYWPDYREGFGSQNVGASWIEFVLGTETYLKISKQSKASGKSRFLLGWNARLRFLTDFEKQGRTQDLCNSRLWANIQ
jgi:hypothetical protein